jgi:hypothetical protein
LKRRLDQTPNAIMKTPVLGFTFGILVAVLLERSRPVTMATIRNLHSSHGLASLSPARVRAVQMLMATRIRRIRRERCLSDATTPHEGMKGRPINLFTICLHGWYR